MASKDDFRNPLRVTVKSKKTGKKNSWETRSLNAANMAVSIAEHNASSGTKVGKALNVMGSMSLSKKTRRMVEIGKTASWHHSAQSQQSFKDSKQSQQSFKDSKKK